jgi:hypothetical protein
MSGATRLTGTLIIWISFTIILGIMGAVISDSTLDTAVSGIVFAIILVLTVGVTISTRAIWQSENAPAREIPIAKAKRLQRDRIERLIDALDDDDIYELQARLLAQRDEESRQFPS